MNEYAKAGVDPSLINPFKARMGHVCQVTRALPKRWQCEVFEDGTWRYTGDRRTRNGKPIIEGLGNKNWLAEWMYLFSGQRRTYYECVMFCNAMMAVNDFIVAGGMPVTYNDEVAAGDSQWFADSLRARDCAEGLYQACRAAGMALIGGESPSLKYLVRSQEPVPSAPVLSGCVTGIIAPEERMVTGNIMPGDQIIGITSSGAHANGYSLIIERGLTLPDKFMTRLPDGTIFGEAALQETRCYVDLVAAMNKAEVDVHAYQPGTGGGVGKVAFSKRPLKYYIHTWPRVPMIMQYMHEHFGIPLDQCLAAFNWGVGYYEFVPKHEAKRACMVAQQAGYDASVVGHVMEGERGTIFGPAGDLPLPPPSE